MSIIIKNNIKYFNDGYFLYPIVCSCGENITMHRDEGNFYEYDFDKNDFVETGGEILEEEFECSSCNEEYDRLTTSDI